MKKIRHGIIGLGKTVGIAGAHIQGLQECSGIQLVAVYDVERSMAQDMCDEFSLTDIAICDTEEEFFAQIDSVSICTPNNTHVDVAMRAVTHGLHVLIEKPISTNAALVAPLEALCEQHPEQVIMVSFNYREFNFYKEIKAILENGTLGKIYLYRQQLGGARIANPHVCREWRMNAQTSGSGALADFGCHMLDLAVWFTQDSCGKIVQTDAQLATAIETRTALASDAIETVDNDDCAVFIAKSESGTLYNFTASRVGVCNHTIEIVGEGGMLSVNVDADEGIVLWCKEPDGSYRVEDKKVIPVVPKRGHDGILQHFVDCIEGTAINTRTVSYAKEIQTLIDEMWEANK
ncbi:MAG: Gfo/Idh/MocA family oxidoreductase [Faecalibacterium sp.]